MSSEPLCFNEKLDGINFCSVFNSLNASEKAMLANLGTIETVEKGSILFSFESTGDSFFLVLSGHLKGRLNTNERKKFKRGQLFGEVGVFDGNHRTGIIRAAEKSKVLRFDSKIISEPGYFEPSVRLNIILCLVKSMVSYLYDAQQSVLDLIKKGENETVEFKENIHEKNYSEILKSIISMSNHKGGTVLIGVKDDKTIVGTDFDMDKLMKDIEAFAQSKIGNVLLSIVHISFENIQDKKVLRIDCDISDKVIFWNQDGKGDVLFVRGNSVNRRLHTVREIANYLQKRQRS
ncbi:MAG: RNA-binding domain-containing protein [Bacteroidota bacterium]